LTLERDSQHIWTVGGEWALQQKKERAQKSTQLSGFAKRLGEDQKTETTIELSNHNSEQHTDTGI